MEYPADKRELQFPNNNAITRVNAWRGGDIALMKAKGGCTVVLTHGAEDGTLSLGKGKPSVAPKQFMDLLTEVIGAPSEDVFILACYPGKWKDFRHSEECRVYSIGEWECPTHVDWHMAAADESGREVLVAHLTPEDEMC